MNAVGHKVVAGLLFMLFFVIFGALIGALLATRVFGGSSMGWDQLADMLGGFMVGAVVALPVGSLVVRWAPPRRLYFAAAAAAVACAVAIAVAQLTRS